MRLLLFLLCYSDMKIFLDKRSICINLRFFFSAHVVVILKISLVDGLGVRIVENQKLYLGLPMVIERDRKVIFARIKD